MTSQGDPQQVGLRANRWASIPHAVWRAKRQQGRTTHTTAAVTGPFHDFAGIQGPFHDVAGIQGPFHDVAGIRGPSMTSLGYRGPSLDVAGILLHYSSHDRGPDVAGILLLLSTLLPGLSRKKLPLPRSVLFW